MNNDQVNDIKNRDRLLERELYVYASLFSGP
jgi:hypothetical protein